MKQTKNYYFLLVFAFTSFSLFSQNTQQMAVQAFNTGDYDAALSKLDSVVQAGQANYGTWYYMASSHQAKKDHKKAVKAFQEALSLNPTGGNAKINLALAHAQAGDIDLAFEQLFEMRKAKNVNLTNLALFPANSAIKDDPRYPELMPSKEEFADPLIEEAKIIHEWVGEAVGDQFGWIARNVGDVNKDGIDDTVISAPTSNEAVPGGGKIYVYSGKTGELLWERVGQDSSGNLGLIIEMAGDVNADGIPDVVGTAPAANKTFVYSGKDGTTLWEWEGSDKRGVFGRAAKGCGDVNKDGYADVIVGEPFQLWGAPINAPTIERAGKLYVYSGKDGSILKSWEGEKIGDGFGTACGGATVDGTTYIVCGAPNASDNQGGKVYVYKGLNDEPAFVIKADSTGQQLGGMFLSVVGDVNADGTPDVYAADWANAAKGPSTGRTYIHSGATGEQLYVHTGETAGDGFGIGVADTGDVNDDGHDDFLIGAWQHGSAAVSGGKCYLYSGKTGEVMRLMTGQVIGETFGFDTTNLGDVNGDGKIDFLITSAWSAIKGYRTGRVFVIAGE